MAGVLEGPGSRDSPQQGQRTHSIAEGQGRLGSIFLGPKSTGKSCSIWCLEKGTPGLPRHPRSAKKGYMEQCPLLLCRSVAWGQEMTPLFQINPEAFEEKRPLGMP